MIQLDNSPSLLALQPALAESISGTDTAAGSGDRAGLQSAAEQFESLFIQMLLKNMRAASLSEGMLDNSGSELYLDMFDKEIAAKMSSTQSLGIAKIMVEQLGRTDAHAGEGAPGHDSSALASRLGTGITLPTAPAIPNRAPAAEVNAHAWGADLSAGPAEQSPAAASPARFDSPAEFVGRLKSAAQIPARSLGVSSETLLAQSALETGWGKHIPLRPDQSSSHNLFGIKAGAGWTGDTVTKTTLEYENGIATPRKDVFRAYDSFEQSFADYVQLISGSSRYREAVARRDDPQAFFTALQHAGYATDPAYANKAMGVLTGETMQVALARVDAD